MLALEQVNIILLLLLMKFRMRLLYNILVPEEIEHNLRDYI